MIVRKTLVLLFIMFLQSCFAMASNENSHNKYIAGELVYEFKKVPKYDGSGKFMYNTGQISVTNKDGQLLSMSRYNQSPGCEVDFPTIRSLKIPLSSPNKSKKQTFILFCGSNEGRHKTLRFYNPRFGFVSAIDFFDGPVDLREGETEINLVINHKKYFKSVNKLIYYPVVYRLISNQLSVSLSVDNSEKSKDIYRSILEDKSEKLTDDISDLIRVLIVSISSDDKENYCRISMNLTKNKFRSIQEDLVDTLDKDFTFKCRGK